MAFKFLDFFSVSPRGILYLEGAHYSHKSKLSDLLANTAGPIIITSFTGLQKFEDSDIVENNHYLNSLGFLKS